MAAVLPTTLKIQHERFAVFRFQPRPLIHAGQILPKGRVLPSRDGRIELPWPALVNATEYTGRPGVQGEYVVYYTYIRPTAH